MPKFAISVPRARGIKPNFKINMNIRNANKKDIEQIFALGKRINELKFSKRGKFHDKDEFLEFVKKPEENIILVADLNNKIVGFVFTKIISKHWAMIDNLAVDAKFRKHGIGTRLIEQLYKILRKRKVDYIQILEEVHHKKTRKFWHDKGFKEEKVFVWADRFLR